MAFFYPWFSKGWGIFCHYNTSMTFIILHGVKLKNDKYQNLLYMLMWPSTGTIRIEWNQTQYCYNFFLWGFLMEKPLSLKHIKLQYLLFTYRYPKSTLTYEVIYMFLSSFVTKVLSSLEMASNNKKLHFH